MHFQQGSAVVEALNSACPSRCQRHVRHPVQMRWGARAFSRVSTGDSNNPFSSEMKDRPAFKPLQGNLAFFPVRASQCPFHLRQQNQGPSHISIAEGSLLLMGWWKVGIPLQSKSRNKISSRDDLGCTELSSSYCADLVFL